MILIRVLLAFCVYLSSLGAGLTLNTTEGLEVKERYRRLIPYMTFYVTQGNGPQAYYQTGQQYTPVVAISNKVEPPGGRLAPYIVPVIPQQPQPQPQGYVLQQQPSALTRMITQNYLAIAKQSNIPLQDRFNFNQYKPQPIVQPLPQAQPLVRVQPLPQEQPLVRVQPTKQQLIQLLQRKQFLLQNAQPVRTLARPPVQPPSEDIVTITQSQEIPVQQPTPLPPGGYELPLYQEDRPKVAFIPRPPTYEKPEPEKSPSYQSEEVEDRHEENFNTILEGYQLSKALPERITSENLDSSIKTLTKLLKILQKAHALPQSARQLVNSFPKNDGTFAARAKELAKKIPPLRQEGSTPGRPGVDYPAHTDIPETHFNCKDQRYKGFFGDPETGCQVWHYCDLNGGQASFLCPNGTIFSQVALTCDWWFNVKCSSTAQLYVLNERLYKYILPQKPSFPEDFAGPLVDRYLTLKFQEIERNKTEEALKKEMESANEKEEDSSSEKADKEPEEEEEEEEKEMPAAD